MLAFARDSSPPLADQNDDAVGFGWRIVIANGVKQSGVNRQRLPRLAQSQARNDDGVVC